MPTTIKPGQPVVPVTVTDQTLMTFGKHKGKPMIKVSAKWLLWLWKQNELSYPILKYIEDNFDTIKADAAMEDQEQ